MDHGFPRLLGDVGGTHARWAWQADPASPLQDISVVRCNANASLYESASQYLAQRCVEPIRAAGIGIATAVSGDDVRMTNHPWTFSIRDLQRCLGVERCLVINDFTALALSLPALGPADLLAIGDRDGERDGNGDGDGNGNGNGNGDGDGDRNGNRNGNAAASGTVFGLLGPGTGLGVSGLMSLAGGAWSALSGEGGHVTLAAADEREAAVLALLRARCGHASAERALSGPGLVTLYDALCRLDGTLPAPLQPTDVSTAALNGSDAHCVQAVSLFASLLGNVAGNLALTLGARGGIYLGGGVVPRLGSAFDAALFRRRFEDKGRFAPYLAAVPTWLITAATPALTGVARALDTLPG